MLAVADALRVRDPGASLTCVGTARGLEVMLVPARGHDLRLIPPVPMPRRPTLDLFRVPDRLVTSVRTAAGILRDTGAQVLVGFGGYVALPAYLAARRAGIPIVVHEQNAVPGLANRIGARFVAAVAVSFPGTPLHGAEFVGMPLRPEIADLDRPSVRATGRAHFGLELDRPTLLVFGGSQGARTLNNAMTGAVDALRDRGIQILHAVGPKNELRPHASTAGQTVPYVALPYIERMDLAYAAADLSLCRAGAVTCAELAAVGLPAVFVPLPIGNGEQRHNAAPVVAAGGGLLVDDRDLSADYLLDIVAPLLFDEPRLTSMGAAAAGLGRRDAAAKMAELVLDAADKGRQL